MVNVVHVQKTHCAHPRAPKSSSLSTITLVLLAVERECSHCLSVSKSELIVTVLLGENDHCRQRALCLAGQLLSSSAHFFYLHFLYTVPEREQRSHWYWSPVPKDFNITVILSIYIRSEVSSFFFPLLFTNPASTKPLSIPTPNSGLLCFFSMNSSAKVKHQETPLN